MIVEPETIAAQALPAFIRAACDAGGGAIHAPEFVARVRHTLARLQGCGEPLALDDAAFDTTFFGAALAASGRDARIAKFLADIAGNPAALLAAQEHPELRQLLALDADSRVLLLGSEGDTDAQIYRSIVGRTAEEVLA